MTEPCALHGIPGCTSCWLEEHRDATTADYIRAEAERLPNGTAAKFLAAIQPDTVTNVRCACAICLADMPVTIANGRYQFAACPNGHTPKPDTVTIQISREAAEHMARHYNFFDAEKREVAAACRAAINLSEGTEEEK